MKLEYNPAKIMKEAKSRVAKADKKKSIGKGIKRALISIVAFAIVTALVTFLNRAGVEITPEEKRAITEIIVQIFVGGGLLSFSSFAFANATKKRAD